MPVRPIQGGSLNTWGSELNSWGDTFALNVFDYGVQVDGATDDTAAIQSAIDAVPAAAGTVYFPAGIYVVNGTLDLTDRENVHLIGAGADNGPYFGAPTTGTVFKRLSGTGTMLEWSASVGAASALLGCKIEGISFDCNTLAESGIDLRSIFMGQFRDINIHQPTDIGLNLNVVNTLGVSNTMCCAFDLITVTCFNTADARGIVLDGVVGVGNSCFNTFVNTIIHGDDGPGVQFGYTDSNRFYGLGCDTTIGVEFLASNTGSYFCSDNEVHNVDALGGIYSRGTPSGAHPALDNTVYFSAGNAPNHRPVIEAGSTLHYSDTKGITLPEYRTHTETRDEFLGGNNTSGSIGELGWITNGSGTFVTPTVADHPGIVNIDSTASSGTYAALGLHVNGNGWISATDDFDITLVVRLNTNDVNTQVRIGLAANYTDGSTDGMYFEKLFADTSWFGVTLAASTQTRTAALAATSTNWIVLRVRRIIGTSTIGFTAGGGTEVVASTNIPVASVQPVISIKNNAAASKTLDVDYFHCAIFGLART